MTNLPPDQLQAIAALLQQGTIGVDEAMARTFPVAFDTLPAALQNLQRAAVLEGTAMRASLDQILLRTAQGDVILKPQQLKDQMLMEMLPARVSVQLRPGPNGLEAVLVVGNKAVSGNRATEQTAGTNLTASSAQTLTEEIPKVGQVFKATVLPSSLFATLGQPMKHGADGFPARAQTSSAQGGAVNPNNPLAPSPSAMTTAGINTAVTGAASLGKNPSVALPESLTQKIAFAPPTQNQGAPTQVPSQKESPRVVVSEKSAITVASAAPQGEAQALPQTSIKILKVITPDTPQAQKPEEGSLATVRGQTPSGQPVLTVGDTVVAVRANRTWPLNTQLQVSLGEGAALVTGKDVTGAPALIDHLQEALEVLARDAPSLLRDVTRLRLPQASTPQNMPGALLFFLSALQKNDVRFWLSGDTEDTLEKLNRKELFKKIQDEWQTGAQEYIEDATGSWHGLTVPFMENDKLQAFRFFIHAQARRKQEKEGRDDAWAKRFLIDVSLSRLGPVQLDGLVHPKKLELVVRTDSPLSPDLRNDLRGYFVKAMEEVRYTGELRFQANKTGWITLKQAHLSHLAKNI